MKYRKMGSLGWEVSALGFGAMRLPVDEQSHLNENEAIKMIRYAIGNGVNNVDTAYPYHGGQSEVIVGKALENRYREKVHLTTKLPIWMVRKKNHFERYFDRQVKRLQSNPDIYLFHGLNKQRFEKVKELDLIENMENARDQGKIKHIGFSFHDTFEVFKEIIDSYSWDCAQIQLNYLDVNYQAGLKGLKYAAKKGIAVIIMEPIRGGKLAISKKVLNTRPEIKNVLDSVRKARAMPDWALQFLWDRPEVSVVLSGMSEMQHVIENVESANNSGIGSLTDEELQVVRNLRTAYKSHDLVPCTGCEYCVPCPNGVSIPTIMNLVNEMGYWGEEQKHRYEMAYNRMAKTPEDLKARSESGDETEGAASLCSQCGDCLEKCPQQINIPRIMDVVNGIFNEEFKISEIKTLKKQES
jgi:predicted aldo/keto reductase-like oxidoreductase